ncbi:MAG: cellulase family glycosylhydrolase [Chloroflexi bacterium]|nr:cellulase family glycosylhydrolase [Chloroflexota bacterium]
MLFPPQTLRKLAIILFIPIPFLACALIVGLLWRGGTLYDLTGEERLSAQIKGLTDLSADLMRPGLDLAETEAAAHSGVNPFGVNVFLDQEPSPDVREAVVKMAAEAGFRWLRQEFVWEDIEIHGKGDFEDRRHEPHRSAWQKYDHIVDLAEQYGLELIVRVSNPPEWTRTAGNEIGPYAPPDDYQDYADFVASLVDRYKGRIRYYQLWNEPNIYPEWGNHAISPEDYSELLCTAAAAARAADADVVIINGALASTIVLQPEAAPPGNAFNDFLFLQRMYGTGAADCFDIVAMQGYGLWSGPSDRRMNPRVLNFSRPLFVRDLMVANGDAHKPIWISEMNWNAVPDEIVDKRFGQVTEAQQARYLAEAYQRIQQDWPWLGVANTWYFKRPDYQWRDEAKPEYYFRLVDPDLTPLPVYDSIRAYANEINADPVMYAGAHPPEHWAIHSDDYHIEPHPEATLGQIGVLAAGASLKLTFDGASLRIHPPKDAPETTLSVSLNGGQPQERVIEPGKMLKISARGREEHRVEISTSADLWVGHWYVKDGDLSQWFWPLACGFGLLLAIFGALVVGWAFRSTTADPAL